MQCQRKEKKNPWSWVPSLYYAEGIPLIIISAVSVIMYKNMGVSNAEIAFYTSWLYLPWVIKPLWGPLVDIFRTKRLWIVITQLLMGAGFACVALSMPLPSYFIATICFFWLLAFNSATHDIAADGFYMLALDEHQQAWFVGIRSTFYRLAVLTGQGLLVMLAGHIQACTGLKPVELEVRSVNNPSEFQRTFHAKIPEDGKQKILLSVSSISIPCRKMSRDEFEFHLDNAKKWNSGDDSVDFAAFPSKGAEKSSGNIGTVRLKLSNPPEKGERIIVNLGREGGDKKISLLEGSHFEFTSENWNRPAIALFQLDPKLKYDASAKFVARSGNIPLSWMISFFTIAVFFFLIAVYHFFILPKPAADVPKHIPASGAVSFFQDFFKIFLSFFTKEGIIPALLFLLLFRLGEAQLVKLAAPFLMDLQEEGGLAMSTGKVGLVYGTIGMVMLVFGGIAGGFFAARDGLKKWLWPMALAINVPDVVYVYMAWALPDNFLLVSLCVACEQFGYGFGFTAYMLFMVYFAEGEYKTSHFAIMTGLMALGMMLPGLVSGYIQSKTGYHYFFIWVLVSTIPGFLILPFLRISPEFGKKKGASG